VSEQGDRGLGKYSSSCRHFAASHQIQCCSLLAMQVHIWVTCSGPSGLVFRARAQWQ
jgi:hypothetical protein